MSRTSRRFPSQLLTIGWMAVAGFLALLAIHARPVIADDDEDLSEFETVWIESSLDSSPQLARFYKPKDQEEAGPLLVLLHTWSGTYRQQSHAPQVLAMCRKRGWTLIMPNFRGPNRRPEACASDLAVRDVLDAVEYAKREAKVDEERVYLVGASGGGHMSLMMAGRAPDVWAGVSAWVPITDLAAWHRQCKQAKRKYWRDLEAVCGGPPGASDEIDAKYRKRSPLFHLHRATGLAIEINAGIHDGHTGSVPVCHTLRGFNRLAAANGQSGKRVSDETIEHMVQKRTVPERLRWDGEQDSKREKPILFRRAAGPVRVTVFDGGHEAEMPAAVEWLAGQRREAD